MNGWWDRLLGTYKAVPMGEEFLSEERSRGPFELHWRRVDAAQAAEHERAVRARRRSFRESQRAGSGPLQAQEQPPSHPGPLAIDT